MSETHEKSTENKEEKMKKVSKMIESREKQLSDMANMLADLNQQLNDTQVKNKHLADEIEGLKETLDKKDSQLKQELTEKELMFSKLQTLERENDKLNVLSKKDEKPSFLSSLKKGLQTFVSNRQNSAQPQKILTSKQAIQIEKEKEKTVKKKEEDFELGNLQKTDYNKKSEEAETHEDILERIRQNLNMEEQNNSGENIDAAPKDKNRESVDSLTEQINKNSENVFK